MPNHLKEIEKIAEDLIDKLGVSAETSVSQTEEKSYRIDFDGEDAGLLIGYHGETLSALQVIFGMMMYKSLGEWVRILVNVGDYREMREEKLTELANRAADKVRFLQSPITLPPMSSYERRLVHTTLSTRGEEIITESVGRGRERRVVVRPVGKGISQPTSKPTVKSEK
jgi:spoIIIJ-associated protein